MTSKADFTAEEWETIAEAPATAGMLVIFASRGGTVRETFSMAKAWVSARDESDESELLDEIAAEKPKIDKEDYGSLEELRAKGPDQLVAAVGLLEAKATPADVEAYKQFVIGLAQRVAEAHKEGGFLGIGGEEVSSGEASALAQIAAALGVDPPAPATEAADPPTPE